MGCDTRARARVHTHTHTHTLTHTRLGDRVHLDPAEQARQQQRVHVPDGLLQPPPLRARARACVCLEDGEGGIVCVRVCVRVRACVCARVWARPCPCAALMHCAARALERRERGERGGGGRGAGLGSSAGLAAAPSRPRLVPVTSPSHSRHVPITDPSRSRHVPVTYPHAPARCRRRPTRGGGAGPVAAKPVCARMRAHERARAREKERREGGKE